MDPTSANGCSKIIKHQTTARASFSQSARLVNLAGFFQRASIVTSFGWLTALFAQALAAAS